jgi:hypothetical protein
MITYYSVNILPNEKVRKFLLPDSVVEKAKRFSISSEPDWTIYKFSPGTHKKYLVAKQGEVEGLPYDLYIVNIPPGMTSESYLAVVE